MLTYPANLMLIYTFAAILPETTVKISNLCIGRNFPAYRIIDKSIRIYYQIFKNATSRLKVGPRHEVDIVVCLSALDEKTFNRISCIDKVFEAIIEN